MRYDGDPAPDRGRQGGSAVPLAARAALPCTSAAFAQLTAEILRAGVALRFRARGTSMAPLVRDGDVLLVRPLDPDSVRVGDVVLCESEPGRVVAHRVVRKKMGGEGSRFTVQGDALSHPDGFIPAGRIYGRVAWIERAGTQINMDSPVLRWLGRLAALRSRWNVGRGRWLGPARRLVKRLPVLSRYLAYQGGSG